MRKVLLAIDGSEQSESTIDEIASRLFPPDSEVRIISVVEPPYLPETFAGGGGDTHLYMEMGNAARARAHAMVEKAAAKIRSAQEKRQLKVTTEVFSGSAKRAILEEADAFGADLIVVGSHGHGVLERFLLGSVSQAVALHAKCSVEIVRSPKTKAG